MSWIYPSTFAYSSSKFNAFAITPAVLPTQIECKIQSSFFAIPLQLFNKFNVVETFNEFWTCFDKSSLEINFNSSLTSIKIFPNKFWCFKFLQSSHEHSPQVLSCHPVVSSINSIDPVFNNSSKQSLFCLNFSITTFFIESYLTLSQSSLMNLDNSLLTCFASSGESFNINFLISLSLNFW